ncbi:MAG TPA: phasin family protein [Nevskiaceae bacterium]|nr:phasin family protein [Nevskiaceae bacterium]
MVAKSTLNNIRSRIERLRKDSVDTATAANKIVSKGVQRIADNELKALNDTYKATLKSLKQARGTGSPRDVAARQIDVLQDTANRLIASARDALGVAAQTRTELMQLMRKQANGADVAKKEVDAVTQRARTAVNKVSTAARKATQNGSTQAKAQTRSAAKQVHKAAKSASGAAATIGKAAQSRAGAATSRAKKTARSTIAAGVAPTASKSGTPPPAASST